MPTLIDVERWGLLTQNPGCKWSRVKLRDVEMLFDPFASNDYQQCFTRTIHNTINVGGSNTIPPPTAPAGYQETIWSAVIEQFGVAPNHSVAINVSFPIAIYGIERVVDATTRAPMPGAHNHKGPVQYIDFGGGLSNAEWNFKPFEDTDAVQLSATLTVDCANPRNPTVSNATNSAETATQIGKVYA